VQTNLQYIYMCVCVCVCVCVFHASRHQISLTYEQNTLGNQPTHLQRIVMKENKFVTIVGCWFYHLVIFLFAFLIYFL